jgi:hypothetical protein
MSPNRRFGDITWRVDCVSARLRKRQTLSLSLGWKWRHRVVISEGKVAKDAESASFASDPKEEMISTFGSKTETVSVFAWEMRKSFPHFRHRSRSAPRNPGNDFRGFRPQSRSDAKPGSPVGLAGIAYTVDVGLDEPAEAGWPLTGDWSSIRQATLLPRARAYVLIVKYVGLATFPVSNFERLDLSI